MIEHARENDGLYYLELPFGQNRIENQVPLSFISEIPSTTKDKIGFIIVVLDIRCLVFPLLFKGIDVAKLHCEVCEFARHRYAFFPISNKIVSTPFATILNISGCR